MNILIIDDSLLNHLTFNEILVDNYFITNCSSCLQGKEYIDQPQYSFDTIIINMITQGSLELMRHIKKQSHTQNIPIIAIIPSDASQEKIYAFNNGAYDYVYKPFVSDIINNRVKNACHYYTRFREIVDEKSYASQPEKLDYLKQIFNFDTTKWLIDERLQLKNSEYALLYFKIESLDELRESEGQIALNDTIKAITSFITRQFRKDDIVGRIDDSQFVIFIDNAIAIEFINEKIEDMLRLFKQKYQEYIGKKSRVNVGLSFSNNENLTFDDLLRIAKDNIKNFSDY